MIRAFEAVLCTTIIFKRRSKMTWHHQKVYDALLKKGNYQKEGKQDVYVSLDHHRLGDLSMVLYNQDSESYKNSPLHVNKSRSGFSADLFKKIVPAIQKTSRGEAELVRYEVKDWDKFAEALGL
jgi:hypothetical protein